MPLLCEAAERVLLQRATTPSQDAPAVFRWRGLPGIERDEREAHSRMHPGSKDAGFSLFKLTGSDDSEGSGPRGVKQTLSPR